MGTGLFATAACDIADGRNGRMALASLASTQIVAGREFRDAFGRMANALFNGREGDAIDALGDVATYAGMLNTMALKAVDSDNRYRRVSLELTAAKRERDAKAGALRDCERAESTSAELAQSYKSDLDSAMAANAELVRNNTRLEARNATQAETIRALTAELEDVRSDLTVATSHAETCAGQANRSDAEWIVADERAKAAERQLAEYRAILATLPYGMARAYPGALVLMRAYLADVESADRQAAVRYCVDGHTFADAESDLAGDGAFPPFRVFHIESQDYIGGTYTTREAAQRAADTLNASA
jgi:hypothetical protein